MASKDMNVSFEINSIAVLKNFEKIIKKVNENSIVSSSISKNRISLEEHKKSLKIYWLIYLGKKEYNEKIIFVI